MLGGCVACGRAGVALIDVGHLKRRSRRLLHGLRQDGDLVAILVMAGVTCSASSWRRVSTARWTLLHRLRL